MNDIALRLSNVSKRYRRNVVLEGLTLQIEAGEFFALVGVNGAGKTTCIKSILDFCDISSGTIEIFGCTHRLTVSRERLAYLPERFLPPYYLTGGDFLTFMSRLYGIEFSAERIGQMLRTLDLDESVLGKPVRQYSKGMAQKLGLAACFLSQRDLVILDEPMSGLDPKARILLKRHLMSLRAQHRSVFFSTHMLADVEQMCDRMGVLHNGQLQFVGTPAECCQVYAADTLEQAYLNCVDTVPNE